MLLVSQGHPDTRHRSNSVKLCQSRNRAWDISWWECSSHLCDFSWHLRAPQRLLRSVDLSTDVAEGNSFVPTTPPPRERPKPMEGWQNCFPQARGSDTLSCNPGRSYLWDPWTQLQVTRPQHTPRHRALLGEPQPYILQPQSCSCLKLPSGQRGGTAEAAKPQGNAGHRLGVTARAGQCWRSSEQDAGRGTASASQQSCRHEPQHGEGCLSHLQTLQLC